jgi:hypothetical protein
MLLPIIALFASFLAATALGLLGAYVAGTFGAVTGMGFGFVLTFVLLARWAGR